MSTTGPGSQPDNGEELDDDDDAPELYRVPTPAGKSWIFFGKISRPWKVLENGFGPGKSWNFLLGYDVVGRQWCRCRCRCYFSVTVINIYLNIDAVIIRCIYIYVVS